MCLAAVLELLEIRDYCKVTLKLTKYKPEVSKIEPSC